MYVLLGKKSCCHILYPAMWPRAEPKWGCHTVGCKSVEEFDTPVANISIESQPTV
jgi:hypothetical protein